MKSDRPAVHRHGRRASAAPDRAAATRTRPAHADSSLEHEARRAARDVVAPLSASEASASAGSPAGARLAPGLRAYFEPRFGTDLSAVRLHADADAARAAAALDTRAFTMGSHIGFASGALAPGSLEGGRVLAHELAHVSQNQRLASAPLIQRYGGSEHQDLGDRYLGELLTFLQTERGAAWAQQLGFSRDDLVAQINADPLQGSGRISLPPRLNARTGRVEQEKLTPGEVISLMGDFYETVDQLANAPATELRDILAVMQQERAGTARNADAQFERITGGRYIDLAGRNDTHFARLNRSEWRRLHEEAITEAQGAGREHSEARFQRALLIDAAGGHFLTDAFAAGHLFDKSEVLAAITLHTQTHTTVTRNPQLQGYVGLVSLAGRLPQLVLKNIHDRLNREGFEISNARGMRWRTFGDSHLDVAQETQRIAALAVFLSRQQILAARSGTSPNPADIEALMPDDDSVQRATAQAIAFIPDAVTEVEGLIYRNRSIAPSQFGAVLGSIVESNLSTIGNPGREREISEMLESARRTGQGSVVAPSFTVFSWK